MSQFSIVRITADNAHHHLGGFVEAYQAVFAGPPYFEAYTHDEVVESAWDPHRVHGEIVVVLLEDRVIGFGCAASPSGIPQGVQGFLDERFADKSLACELDDLWYMSEVGVLEEYRGKDLGYRLVQERLKLIIDAGAGHYVMRTARNGSNSEHLYQRIGSTRLPGIHDVSATGQVTENNSQSTERIYYYGRCDRALDRLRTLIA